VILIVLFLFCVSFFVHVLLAWRKVADYLSITATRADECGTTSRAEHFGALSYDYFRDVRSRQKLWSWLPDYQQSK
jgi:hypothetical protein